MFFNQNTIGAIRPESSSHTDFFFIALVFISATRLESAIGVFHHLQSLTVSSVHFSFDPALRRYSCFADYFGSFSSGLAAELIRSRILDKNSDFTIFVVALPYPLCRWAFRFAGNGRRTITDDNTCLFLSDYHPPRPRDNGR